MDVNSDITGLYAQPGFHPEARYEFKVHLDGADFEDLTYRVSFGEPDSGGRQTLQLHALAGEQAREDSAAGELVLQGRTGEAASADGTRLWAGRIADSFYIDLSLLAIVNAAVAMGTAPDLSGWRPDDAQNSFAGTSVESIVLEVPHTHPQLRPDARTGVWCATKLATDAGGWRQINRAGHPMMWPIFWPGDTDFSNPANTRHPCAGRRRRRQVHRRPGRGRGGRGGTSDDPHGYGQAVPGAVPRRPSLRDRHPRQLRVRRLQRPDAGRQRARGHALPRHRHRRALRAEARPWPGTCGTAASRTWSPRERRDGNDASIDRQGRHRIYYKDWGAGPPVVFSHGWPLNADAWDDQAFFLASHGYRAIAHDRRGHGRSAQPWAGNDMDTYADDLADLIETLDLHDAALVGHSTGGGEVARYIGRHGTYRVAKAVLLASVPPLMLRTGANPGGLPIEVFDAIRAGLPNDRSQFYQDLSGPFYGANRPGSTVSQGLRDCVLADGHAGRAEGRLRLR